ncbi:MAG: 6-carboxytetrahydropterin synthase QueD [Lentisphaeria bacterium]
MYEIQVKSSFSAAHHLRGYAGDCVNLHGHNWEVVVALQAETLDDQGISMDFRLIKETLSSILDEFDHSELNQHVAFQDKNPTSENMARYLYERLKRELEHEEVHVSRVEVAENEDSRAAYFELNPYENFTEPSLSKR